MVEHSPQCLEVEASSPDTTAGLYVLRFRVRDLAQLLAPVAYMINLLRS
jgi:hypothetical protein